ncbi:(1-_4)-alpha-D-glucan synthase (UDP-glucose) [Humibacillus xanthopallidus]|uniref:D-inositol 3-phosphate glycosyltransferase n=1 Tax=Humibacillus xanthopallidus TaxID=412689 RepID=A0A543PXJ3_9MICO|nr:glycosyltransferase family 4 protein [Humibacillus xanthopallidus]TQN48770.1 (1->4)-alpha-D-glucan synthase (UDP-glucose) [Humibacillus xanthopallidus]
MPARVALVASSYHPYLGGVESHVRHVANELRAGGTEVEVWTVDRGEHLGTTELDGVRVRHLPTPMPARSVGALARFAVAAPGAWRAWRRAYRSLRPEVLHVQCFGPNGVYAAALSRRTRTPLVLSSHGETLADDHDAFGTSALLRRGLREAVSAARVTTACSTWVLDDLRDRFGLVDGVVVPNGVGPAPADPPSSPRDALGLAADAQVVFAVGRLERMKGFDLLVDAVAAMADPDVTLVLGGSGSQRDALEAQARHLGLGSRVRLVGPLDEAGVDAWMRAAQVVAVPSRREAFGIVALEAWRAGTPLVATSLGGPSGFVESGVDGLLVDPRDTEALTVALRTVLDDPALAGSLGAAGRRAVGAYTWTRVAEDYGSIYARVTEPRPTPPR